MKITFILWGVVAFIFTFYFIQSFKQNKKENKIVHGQLPGVQWNDSLFKHLPRGIDTSIIVKDVNGTSLHFSQYIKLVFNHEAIIYQDKGIWRLHPTTKIAYDSMGREDFAVAREPRAMAYRMPDTVQSWEKKLNEISNKLAQADYVLVLKSERKMFIQRKGKNILTFNIDLGFKPIGNKVFEGDGKTPEGIYHLDNKQDREDKFYRSFWISYPNSHDKEIAKSKGLKPGVGIMIHGTNKANINTKDWTAGCIALQNKDIDTLFKYVGDGTLIDIRK